MNIRLQVVACCLLLLLGCTAITKRDGVLYAQSLMQRGQYQQAAVAYQMLAKTQPLFANDFYLLAVTAFIKSGDRRSAQTYITHLKRSSLSPTQYALLNLRVAQVSLLYGGAEQAIKQLNAITPSRLDLKNQAVFYQSLAAAYFLSDNLLPSVEARIKRTTLLKDTLQQQENSRMILSTLHLLLSQTPTLEQPSAPDILGGWMALARLLKNQQFNHSNSEFQSRLDAWKVLFSQHPATRFLTTFSQDHHQTQAKQATTIALFLPELGSYAAEAQIIKKGFKAAHRQSKGPPPTLLFYDSLTTNIVYLYQQAIAAGADLIIGPLSKDKIQTLALNTELTVPVLALNHVVGLSKNNLLQFGLSPIDEATQITTQAKRDGHNKILLLSPDNKQGQRMANYLIKYWQENQGTVLATHTYNPNSKDFSSVIKKLLNLKESNDRYHMLRRLLAIPVQYIERRRQDVDALFLVANPDNARTIYPLLRFYRAANTPVYSPSQIYGGQVNDSQNTDLNSITFCDMPWFFPETYQDEMDMVLFKDSWQQSPKKYIRLFALGVDAFKIGHDINQLNNMPYAGATGFLAVNWENRITRQLVCAKFMKGSPLLQTDTTKFYTP